MSRSTFKILFYVKKGSERANGYLPLMCRLTVDGEIKQFSCKLDVPPKLWDVKTARATGSYLTNIKSIRYLETDNYRQLLQFIDTGPYQIYIMGHSCGNSDRTLLNTLFEHKNCVSIKPYYYEWTDEEGGHSDNYIEIIQNISRNFNSMQLMRDRIVNKLYCRPLPQKPKVAAIE
ncbi:hypothetical protein F2S36_15100 [Alistipes onderdonkii]|uniref:Arm DNA-binding domain-containing protein n=1 Tax=Alistipes onderdonkii TaxID=328813 RepID=A0A9P4DMH4_9BACT|nr:hypothetical protein F2S36_15100 [Alistipes onderdonkii]